MSMSAPTGASLRWWARCQCPGGCEWQVSRYRYSFRSMSKYARLRHFVDRHRRLFVLTGAGCLSGIPDDRDADGQWKRAGAAGEEKTRRRYRARSLVGRRGIRRARQRAHRPLSRLETMGGIELFVTQNYATDAISQRPLSRAPRPFILSILKGSKGSN
jgi:hypothetical protein